MQSMRSDGPTREARYVDRLSRVAATESDDAITNDLCKIIYCCPVGSSHGSPEKFLLMVK
jgi:hypothetical protein